MQWMRERRDSGRRYEHWGDEIGTEHKRRMMVESIMESEHRMKTN